MEIIAFVLVLFFAIDALARNHRSNLKHEAIQKVQGTDQTTSSKVGNAYSHGCTVIAAIGILYAIIAALPALMAAGR